jgi:hypothetical protein
MSDTWVRRQRAELDDVFVLDEASVNVMAARGFEDDLNRSLGSSDLEIKLGWTLDHAETRYVRLRRASPRLSPLHSTKTALRCPSSLCAVLFAMFAIVANVNVPDVQFVQTDFLADL